MVDAREKPHCGENPLNKSSYYSSKVQQRERVKYTKYTCPITVKIIQSNYSQQDALTRQSTMVKPTRKLLQIGSAKPSQCNLQIQSKKTQNRSKNISQTWSMESQHCGQICYGQHSSTCSKFLDICAKGCGLGRYKFLPEKRSKTSSVVPWSKLVNALQFCPKTDLEISYLPNHFAT